MNGCWSYFIRIVRAYVISYEISLLWRANNYDIQGQEHEAEWNYLAAYDEYLSHAVKYLAPLSILMSIK